jgi:hypothetical protein
LHTAADTFGFKVAPVKVTIDADIEQQILQLIKDTSSGDAISSGKA